MAWVLITAVLIGTGKSAGQTDDAGQRAGGASESDGLPFHRDAISRYSLDDLPRSLSIRYGKDVWLGYDLERATVCKVWRAPLGKAGLIASGFVTRSSGTALFEDKSREPWQLRQGGVIAPLSTRYLGCSQRPGYFELSWELRHDSRVLLLAERVPMAVQPGVGVAREVQVQGLRPEEALLPPPRARAAWKLTHRGAESPPAIEGNEWYRLTLR